MALVAALLLVADLVVHSTVQNEMASRIKKATKASSVSAHIDSFPFIYDVAAEGRIGGVRIVAHDVPVGALHLASVELDAHGITLDRHSLFFDRRVEIPSVTSAQVTIEIREAGLAAALSLGALTHVITFPGGDKIEFGLGIAHVTASVAVVGGHELVVTAGDRTLFHLDLSATPLIPPCNLDVRSVADGFDLSCSVAPVPTSVLDLLNTRR